MTTEYKDRRNNRPCTKELIAHGFVKLCGTPANLAAKWGFIALLGFFIGEPTSTAIVALSGKQTDANISLSADVNVNNGGGGNGQQATEDVAHPCSNYLYLAILGGLVGFGGLYGAYRHRKLRQDVIQDKSSRIRELEKMLDSNRTSCGLTQRGDTNPEDL